MKTGFYKTIYGSFLYISETHFTAISNYTPIDETHISHKPIAKLQLNEYELTEIIATEFEQALQQATTAFDKVVNVMNDAINAEYQAKMKILWPLAKRLQEAIQGKDIVVQCKTLDEAKKLAELVDLFEPRSYDYVSRMYSIYWLNKQDKTCFLFPLPLMDGIRHADVEYWSRQTNVSIVQATDFITPPTENYGN